MPACLQMGPCIGSNLLVILIILQSKNNLQPVLSLCITVYVHIVQIYSFTKVHVIAMLLSSYNFLKSLNTFSMVQWSKHWHAKLRIIVQISLEFSKIFWLPGNSSLYIHIQQGGKLLRLLYRFRPRIPPRDCRQISTITEEET